MGTWQHYIWNEHKHCFICVAVVGFLPLCFIGPNALFTYRNILLKSTVHIKILFYLGSLSVNNVRLHM